MKTYSEDNEMQQALIAEEVRFPEVLVESIRKMYPHRGEKKQAVKRIYEALERIAGGEIDGSARTVQEAGLFLRGRVSQAAKEMAGREKKYIPHLATYLHQRRYLRAADTTTELEGMEDAVAILRCYPGVTVNKAWTAKDTDAWMPALRAISDCIDDLTDTMGEGASAHLRARVRRYAEFVASWPDGEMQFVPSIVRWMKEKRYEQSEKFWTRSAQQGYASERSQLHRIA